MVKWVRCAVAALVVGCGAPQPGSVELPRRGMPAVSASQLPKRSAAQGLPVKADEPLVVLETHVAVLEPEPLARLEQSGFSLGRLVVGVNARTTRELARQPGFRDIVEVLREDVRETKRRFPLARPTSMLGFRQFDERWFDSEEMSFDLVGVFNRLDRKAFYSGTCGEVRFVYRLRYRTTQGGEPMAGRLPLSVNVVFLVAPDTERPGQPCSGVAQAWQRPQERASEPLADWLLREGALTPARRRRWTLKSVETNLQTIRLQSTVHTSLAGHIEYAMHVFHPRAAQRTAFVVAPLENMPDVARLRADPELRQRLLTLLKEPATLAAVDRGTLNLPEDFLARRAVSVSPRGLTRPSNRPFRQLFDEADFADLDLNHTETIRTPKALLRRLDGASCTGCHQSRSLAGFHHVGEQAEHDPVAPTLLDGSSMHLAADLERRRRYVADLAAGQTPDEFRPLPERQGAGQGFAAPCGLGDAGFSDWVCNPGLSCRKLEDEEVGSCLPDGGVGMPCEHGVLRPGKSAEHDRVQGMQRVACGDAMRCDLNIQGFPLGACAAPCRGLGPDTVCGTFLDVDGYQNCLRGKTPNRDCAERFVFRTGLRRCDAQARCRQDFVCVTTPEEGVGACVPPYFVFALRNDGYPLMR